MGALNSQLVYKFMECNRRVSLDHLRHRNAELTVISFSKEETFKLQNSLKTNITKYRCIPFQLSALLFKLSYKRSVYTVLQPSFLLTSLCFFPSLPVFLIPGVIAPVALPAYAGRPPFPVQTFPQHRERGRRRIAPIAPCQAPLTQPQVAWTDTVT